MILAALFVFLFGLAIGSFLNVVIFRYNTGAGLNGRSACMHCNKTLTWYELIPLFSFLVQGGRCRKCKSKLSWQYFWVELSTACLFLLTFLMYGEGISTPRGLISFIFSLIAWSLLVVIVVFDVKHKIIPDPFVYTFAALGFLHILFFVPFQSTTVFYVSLLAGPILFLPFYLLWLVSNGRWIGLGDGKLALGIGWMLGLGYGLSAIVLAFWIGAVMSIFIMVIAQLKFNRKTLTMKSEIPFAPFLILGYVLVYFLAIDVIGIHSLFMF
jgi:prepilin signal peptidase PulO-like enzyme (type II secretory pathway)